ncbi:MAG: hypothetical protein ACTHXA_08195 [Gulosibacter sp.]|uniref:hypothetical protein n=1 Tax=Gulosibacter sp. TaxID=2817531 RepID=UPI003F8F043D
MIVAKFRKPAIAALGVVALAGLTACAQIPASDNVTNCEPATAFAVEVTGDGEGQVINENAIASFGLSIALEDGTEIVSPTELMQMPDGTVGPVNLNYLSSFPAPMFGGMPVDFSSVGEAMKCAQAGEQVNATMRVDQLFPEEMAASLPEDLASQSAIVSVDVNQVYHSAASGRISPQQNGIPAVVTAPDGTPGVTMPQEQAPTEQRVGVTINGFGPKVEEGQKLTLHLSAFGWTDGTQLLTTWGNQGPALQLPAGPGDAVYDITTQLVGKSVGSQVVVVVPASAIAAAPDSSFGPDLGQGDAVVFVVDILGAESLDAQ